MTWRYEFLATQDDRTAVLGGGNFRALDVDDARIVLASVVNNIQVPGPTKPDAIRLLDPKGREVWRARLQGTRRRVRR